MVPHSLNIANFKSDQNLISADILAKDRQFLGKLVQISRISHQPLNTSKKIRLPAMARLRGGHKQRCHCITTNTYPRLSG